MYVFNVVVFCNVEIFLHFPKIFQNEFQRILLYAYLNYNLGFSLLSVQV